jgi:hypothetical protein
LTCLPPRAGHDSSSQMTVLADRPVSVATRWSRRPTTHRQGMVRHCASPIAAGCTGRARELLRGNTTRACGSVELPIGRSTYVQQPRIRPVSGALGSSISVDSTMRTH